MVRALIDEVKNCDPILVFLAETKANQNRIKGLQRKLGLTQGITVSFDCRSGGLASTHIDVVVCEGNGQSRGELRGLMATPIQV